METRQSSKRGRPPDESLRPSKTSRALPVDEVVPASEDENLQDEIVPETDSESTSERDRPTGTWFPLKQRLREAFGLLRAFLFIHMEDDRVWLRIRGFLGFHHRSVSWLALLRVRAHQELSLPELLEDFNACVPQNKEEDLKQQELQVVLSALLAVILTGDVKGFRPLFEKLSEERRLAMETLFGEEYKQELSIGGRLLDLPDFRSWFALRKREPQHYIDRSLTDLNVFPHARGWSADQRKHEAKRNAFSRHETRAQEMSALTIRKNTLAKERREHQKKKTWLEDDEQEYEQALQEIKDENKVLTAEKKLMIRICFAQYTVGYHAIQSFFS